MVIAFSVILALTYFFSLIAYVLMVLSDIIVYLHKGVIFFLGVSLGVLFFIISFLIIAHIISLKGER